MAAGSFTHTFDTPLYKGASTINTCLFIHGQWVLPAEVPHATIDITNPSDGKYIASISEGGAADVDRAVDAALQAYRTVWGLKCPGTVRGRFLNKLADLVEANQDELAALEAFGVGKNFESARAGDICASVNMLRYFAGWADKVQGKTIETNEKSLAYTRHEPYGVVGAIIPWNFPLLMAVAKIAPILATGNTIVLKPSEVTPLTALRLADLVNEAGIPPGVINIVNGYGKTVGAAIASHMKIAKVTFTGSTFVGREVMHAACASNLKPVTLELGGKNPTIIFDDANLEQAIKWASLAIFHNAGQVCVAGSRIFVQAGIYDQFLTGMTAIATKLERATGDPFTLGTQHGPLVSQAQYDRVMSYIESGKADGAHVLSGGARHGEEGYFIQPTIFTDVKPDMKIFREEIFGPVAAVLKFTTEEEVVQVANNTIYGLSCCVFSQNLSRALRVAHQIEAGSAYVNSGPTGAFNVPFGGYKQSGIGRELGEYALDTYTQVKSVQVNLGLEL